MASTKGQGGNGGGADKGNGEPRKNPRILNITKTDMEVKCIHCNSPRHISLRCPTNAQPAQPAPPAPPPPQAQPQVKVPQRGKDRGVPRGGASTEPAESSAAGERRGNRDREGQGYDPGKQHYHRSENRGSVSQTKVHVKPEPKVERFARQDFAKIYKPNVADSTVCVKRTIEDIKGRMGTSREQWFAPRPGFAVSLEVVRTNFFKFSTGVPRVHEYTVELPKNKEDRDIKNRDKIKSIFQALSNVKDGPLWHKHWVTDQVSIFIIPDPASGEVADPAVGQTFPVSALTYKKLNGEDEELGTIICTFNKSISLDAFDSYCKGTGPDHDIAKTTTVLNAFVSDRARAKSDELTRFGLNKFFDNRKNLELDGALMARCGYSISVRPGMAGQLINVNVATTAFYRRKVLSDFINCILDSSRVPRDTILDHQKRRMINGMIKGLKVRITYERPETFENPNINDDDHRLKRVTGIGEPVESQMFTPRESQPGSPLKSVLELFRGDKNLPIKWPKLPCINVGGTGTTSTEHPIWVPPEYLQIEPNQVFRGKLNPGQTRAMLEIALRLPGANAALIVEDGLKKLGLVGDDANVLLKRYSLNVENTMLKVPARFIEPPTLEYWDNNGTNRVISRPDSRASWNIRTENKFIRTSALPKLRVISLNLPQAIPIDKSLTAFTKELEKYGLERAAHPDHVYLTIPSPAQYRDSPFVRENLVRILKNGFHELSKVAGNVPIKHPVLILIPERDEWLYALIKRLADCELGIPTICSISSKFTQPKYGKPDFQYMANVAMKFNLKLGGTNHVLKATQHENRDFQQTMIVGADVSHSGAGSAEGTPSIAAVVATVDGRIEHYPGSMRLQVARQEIIEDLAEMIEERLVAWYNNKKKFPQAILFYRDGVSESQFSTVREGEIPKVKKGCIAAGRKHPDGKPTQKEEEYVPNITFIVVGKRHNTRFYPIKADQTYKDKGVDNGNLKPGLSVDCEVTSPYFFDFYLQTHAAIRGTARPAHYFVIHDDMKWKAESLQNFTNNLCYCYPRATKGVSYATPAYLADRLCERGRCYIKEYLDNHRTGNYPVREGETLEGQMVQGISSDPKYWKSPTTVENTNPWHADLNNIMFYL